VARTDLRSDCPAGWHAFIDLTGRLSFCSPAALGAVGSVDDLGGSLTSVEVADPYMYLSFGFTPRGNFVREEEVAKRCAVGLVPSQTSGEEVHVGVAGLSAFGCHVVGLAPKGGTLEETSVTAPVGTGDPQLYLNVLTIWSTGDVAGESLSAAITRSLILMP
jgi:hypothetical protein